MSEIPSLWEHQSRAVERAKNERDLALFFDMGTGKTATAIHILRHHLNKNGKMLRVLILAPAAVLKNWENEIGIHSSIPLGYVDALVGTGQKRTRAVIQKTFDQDEGEYSKPGVAIINYEALQRKDILETFKMWRPQILICDESHRLKNFAAKRTKAVAQLADRAEHRYILTGTPIVNSVMDIFGQFRVLDCGDTFGKNQYVFKHAYMYDANASWSHKPTYFPDWRPRTDAFDELNALIEKKSMKIDKHECLDLPPLVEKTIETELASDQWKAYRAMRDDYIAFIEKEHTEPDAVVATQALTKVLRLQQIASGFYKTEDGEIKRFKSVPRLSALSDLLEDYTKGDKVIVWAAFKENYAMIGEALEKKGIKHVFLTGEQDSKSKQESIDAFQTDDSVRVLVGNRKAGGIGVNLTAASVSIVYSRSFSLEEEEQSKARNYRSGSECHEKIYKIDLVCPGTLDEDVLKALKNKQDVAREVLKWQV